MHEKGTSRPEVDREYEGGTKPSEPDQHLAMELEERRAEAEKAVAYDRTELERWQRIGRASHAALAELSEERCDSSDGDEGPRRPW